MYLIKSKINVRTSLGQRLWTSLNRAIATGMVYRKKNKHVTQLCLYYNHWTQYMHEKGAPELTQVSGGSRPAYLPPLPLRTCRQTLTEELSRRPRGELCNWVHPVFRAPLSFSCQRKYMPRKLYKFGSGFYSRKGMGFNIRETIIQLSLYYLLRRVTLPGCLLSRSLTVSQPFLATFQDWLTLWLEAAHKSENTVTLLDHPGEVEHYLKSSLTFFFLNFHRQLF